MPLWLTHLCLVLVLVFTACHHSPPPGLHDCVGGHPSCVGPLQAVLHGPVCYQALGQAGSAVFVIGDELVTQALPSEIVQV